MILRFSAAGLFLTLITGAVFSVSQAPVDSQRELKATACSPELLVTQGRILKVNGAVVTVKTPDEYPGQGGVHPQFVVAGTVLIADLSHARVLTADGKRSDAVPLAAGDQVLLVLSGAEKAFPPPHVRDTKETYAACIVERVATGNKIITH